MWLSLFNWFESAFWTFLAGFLVIQSCRADVRRRRWLRFASVWLVLFAVSDAIEAFTGAWWRPPALLLLKGLCLGALALSFVMLVRKKQVP